jgi:hypothetical protein
LRLPQNGAQRASSHSSVRLTAMTLTLGLVALVGAADPTPAAASSMKVVVVVGPVGSNTANYIYNARKYASQARSYGATVVEIYSPNATWSRVRTAAQGANVLIYLGHGNGYPSPYGAFSSTSKDGFGLNATAGAGNSNTKYFGEYYLRTYIKLAPNSVVILNRLCYASGNSEWGAANPTKSVAIQRVDNFGAGFLRSGARAVFAEGITSASWIIYGLFRTGRSMGTLFRGSPDFNGNYDFQFSSTRTPGYRAWMDPRAPSRYYRSVIGNLNLLASQVRGG